jgi:hypothetical protein
MSTAELDEFPEKVSCNRQSEVEGVSNARCESEPTATSNAKVTSPDTFSTSTLPA